MSGAEWTLAREGCCTPGLCAEDGRKVSDCGICALNRATVKVHAHGLTRDEAHAVLFPRGCPVCHDDGWHAYPVMVDAEKILIRKVACPNGCRPRPKPN